MTVTPLATIGDQMTAAPTATRVIDGDTYSVLADLAGTEFARDLVRQICQSLSARNLSHRVKLAGLSHNPYAGGHLAVLMAALEQDQALLVTTDPGRASDFGSDLYESAKQPEWCTRCQGQRYVTEGGDACSKCEEAAEFADSRIRAAMGR